jgi:adenylate cyclase
MALANFALGYAFTWFGQARDALPLLHKAIRQSPRDPQRASMETMMGYSYFMLREYDEAVEWFKKSSRRSASGSWSHLGLAAAFVALQRIDDARAAINEALRTRPDLSLTSVAAMLRPRYTENNERYLGYLREAGLPE